MKSCRWRTAHVGEQRAVTEASEATCIYADQQQQLIAVMINVMLNQKVTSWQLHVYSMVSQHILIQFSTLRAL